MNSRNKGKRGELELSHVLQGYGYDVKRGHQTNGALGEADCEGLPGIHIECKRVENLNIYKAMHQSESDAIAESSRKGETLVPAVFHRKNNDEWLITMSLKDFIEKFYKEGGEADE